MTWEPVPWAVTNGQASAEIARTSLYASTQGAEGIIGADDLKVTQSATPGASVLISPGASLIPCRSTGQAYQSYAGRNPSNDSVGVQSTTSAARNDLIVARVEDPWLANEPWPDPAVGQEAFGPYIFTRVISGVAASVIASYEAARAYLVSIGSSAIPLAGVALPTNTTSVLNSHITDLRRVASPRKDHKVFTNNPASTFAVSAASLTDWIGPWQVSIPPWATRVVITLTMGGVRHSRLSSSVAGTANGTVRARLGASVVTQAANYDVETTPSNSIARYAVAAADTVAIPANIRGTVQSLYVQANKIAGNVNISADTGTFVVVDLDFQEVAG